MYVHVSHPDGEATLWLNPEVELATQTGLANHVIGDAQQLVETRGHIGNGKVAQWQVRVKIGVTLDD
jgi:hypothetical protein